MPTAATPNTLWPPLVDSAIVFAPAGELVPAALEKLRKGGAISLAGIYMTPIPQLDYQRHVFYERDIHSVTCNTREDGRELLAEAAAIPIRPHTTVYPMADANRALQRPEARPDQRHGGAGNRGRVKTLRQLSKRRNGREIQRLLPVARRIAV